MKAVWLGAVAALAAFSTSTLAQELGGTNIRPTPSQHSGMASGAYSNSPGVSYSGPSAPQAQQQYTPPIQRSAPPAPTAPNLNAVAPRTPISTPSYSYTPTPQPNYQAQQQSALRAQQQAQQNAARAQQQYQYQQQQAQAAQSAAVQRQYQAQSDRANAALMQTPTFGAAPAATTDAGTMNALSCDATCRFNQAMAGQTNR